MHFYIDHVWGVRGIYKIENPWSTAQKAKGNGKAATKLLKKHLLVRKCIIFPVFCSKMNLFIIHPSS